MVDQFYIEITETINEVVVLETVIYVDTLGLAPSEAYTDGKVTSMNLVIAANLATGDSKVASTVTTSDSKVASEVTRCDSKILSASSIIAVADAKAVTADSKALSVSVLTSKADSKAVIADSKALSVSALTSIADSKAVIADSKAVSAGVLAGLEVTAGNLLLLNNSAARHMHLTEQWQKAKQITIPHKGGYRVKFSLNEDVGGGEFGFSPWRHCISRIFKNGAGVGTEQNLETIGGIDIITTYSEDISGLVAGDLLQIWVKTTAEALPSIRVQDFKLCIAERGYDEDNY